MKHMTSFKLASRLFVSAVKAFRRETAVVCDFRIPPRKSHFRTYCNIPFAQSFGPTDQSKTSENNGNGETTIENENNDKTEGKQEVDINLQILEASLQFVSLHGWSLETIAKGAESLGYSGMAHGMFENGPIDLVNFFHVNCNSKLEEELIEMAKQRDEEEKKIGTTQFIRQALEIRLRMNIDYIDRWPQAMAIHMSPSNISTAVKNVGKVLDDIWFYCGDRSTDFSWYAKRGALAAVYKSTELCMIQDKSEDFKDTWAFLDRRLDEVKTIANCIRQAESASKDIGTVGQAGLLTALNIMGLNSKSRKPR